ncbi:hypothetical protein DFH27DRAFT_611793 [Peziza echinospora]|nr:hypothetical protein DFH27DRAFT_611793 [Peziza echinospora]
MQHPHPVQILKASIETLEKIANSTEPPTSPPQLLHYYSYMDEIRQNNTEDKTSPHISTQWFNPSVLPNTPPMEDDRHTADTLRSLSEIGTWWDEILSSNIDNFCGAYPAVEPPSYPAPLPPTENSLTHYPVPPPMHLSTESPSQANMFGVLLPGPIVPKPGAQLPASIPDAMDWPMEWPQVYNITDNRILATLDDIKIDGWTNPSNYAATEEEVLRQQFSQEHANSYYSTSELIDASIWPQYTDEKTSQYLEMSELVGPTPPSTTVDQIWIDGLSNMAIYNTPGAHWGPIHGSTSHLDNTAPPAVLEDTSSPIPAAVATKITEFVVDGSSSMPTLSGEFIPPAEDCTGYNC